jgi:hypothetical protein
MTLKQLRDNALWVFAKLFGIKGWTISVTTCRLQDRGQKDERRLPEEEN